MSASVLYAIENQRLQSTTAKLHERASIQSGKKYQNSRNIKEKTRIISFLANYLNAIRVAKIRQYWIRKVQQ